MSNLKIILTAIAVILGAVIALSAIGMIMTLLQYLFWLGVLCLAAAVAIKVLKKSDSPRLDSASPVKELNSADRALEDYKRKYLSK